jgi:transcription initiation factor TFIID subunit TAF12
LFSSPRQLQGLERAPIFHIATHILSSPKQQQQQQQQPQQQQQQQQTRYLQGNVSARISRHFSSHNGANSFKSVLCMKYGTANGSADVQPCVVQTHNFQLQTQHTHTNKRTLQ